MRQRSHDRTREAGPSILVAAFTIVGLLATGCGGGGAPSVSCAATVEAYCAASGITCLMSWSDVEARGCPGASGFGPLGGPLLQSSAACDGFNWVTSGGTDTSTTYYYAAASGNLVAVIYYSAIGDSYSCTAGPTTFKRPNCGDHGRTCVQDGGSN